jgi:DNA-binding NarL/FixJ family response regulator
VTERAERAFDESRSARFVGTGVSGSGRKKEPMLEPSKRSQEIVSTAVIQTSVVLVEGNRLLREGLVAMVGEQEDLVIVGALGNRHETLEHVRRVKPDVVLIELGLRKQDDERLVEALTGGNPGVRVIVMDMPPGEADIFALIRAGVWGFILKDARFDEFLTTIRLVVSGTHVLPPPLADTLFSEIANQEARCAKTLLSSGAILTKREREITMLIADGLSNKEIASRLNVATFTVKSHVHNVLEKLTLRTRLQIASYYVKESATVTAAADNYPGKGRYNASSR